MRVLSIMKNIGIYTKTSLLVGLNKSYNIMYYS